MRIRTLPLLVIAPLLGGCLFLCTFAIPATIYLDAVIRVQRARGAGEQSLGDINWWFTDRLVDFEVGNQAPTTDQLPQAALESGVPTFSIALNGPIGSRFGASGTASTIVRVATLIVVNYCLGAMIGACAASVYFYRRMGDVPRGHAPRMLAGVFVRVVTAGCVRSGWCGAFAWY